MYNLHSITVMKKKFERSLTIQHNLSESCSHKHSRPTNPSLISFSFPPLLDLCVFFSCSLSVFPRLDIFVGGTFYVGWLIVMAAGSLMHGRCGGVVIPSYVSSPDVLLTAIDFTLPTFPAFSLGTSSSPSASPKKGKLATERDVQKLNFQWESSFYSLFYPCTLCLSLSFYLFKALLRLHSAT